MEKRMKIWRIMSLSFSLLSLTVVIGMNIKIISLKKKLAQHPVVKISNTGSAEVSHQYVSSKSVVYLETTNRRRLGMYTDQPTEIKISVNRWNNARHRANVEKMNGIIELKYYKGLVKELEVKQFVDGASSE